MKLYYHPASTTFRIILMFAAAEGIALDYELVDLMKGDQLEPEFKALNPNSLVPLLDDDGFRLTESGAIVRYLADKAGSAAYPKELKARARVDEALQWFYSNYYKDAGYGLVYPQRFPHHKRPTDEIQAGTIAWGADYPNVRRWIGNMRALKHWAEVHQVADGFAASLKDRQFVSI